jgi:hypothetical protein
LKYRPAEINQRKQAGWFGLAFTIILWIAFIYFHVPTIWKILLFYTSASIATGFLQAAFHFCANFGMRGVFNFGSKVGKIDTVFQAEFRRKDRRKTWQIVLYLAILGIL